MPVTQPAGAITHPFNGSGVADVRFASDGTMWVAWQATMYHIAVATGQILEQYALARQIIAFDISPDGRYVLTVDQPFAGFTAHQSRIDTQTHVVTGNTYGAGGDIVGSFRDVVFINNSTALISQNNSAGKLLTYDASFNILFSS